MYIYIYIYSKYLLKWDKPESLFIISEVENTCPSESFFWTTYPLPGGCASLISGLIGIQKRTDDLMRCPSG